jgi:hypothetical protein
MLPARVCLAQRDGTRSGYCRKSDCRTICFNCRERPSHACLSLPCACELCVFGHIFIFHHQLECFVRLYGSGYGFVSAELRYCHSVNVRWLSSRWCGGSGHRDGCWECRQRHRIMGICQKAAAWIGYRGCPANHLAGVRSPARGLRFLRRGVTGTLCTVPILTTLQGTKRRSGPPGGAASVIPEKRQMAAAHRVPRRGQTGLLGGPRLPQSR